MGSLTDILKTSGGESLIALRNRWLGPTENPAVLIKELRNLQAQGMVRIVGPLKSDLEHAFEADRLEEARKTTVELSSLGYKTIVSSS
jgi:hypothetical protein